MNDDVVVVAPSDVDSELANHRVKTRFIRKLDNVTDKWQHKSAALHEEFKTYARNITVHSERVQEIDENLKWDVVKGVALSVIKTAVVLGLAAGMLALGSVALLPFAYVFGGIALAAGLAGGLSTVEKARKEQAFYRKAIERNARNAQKVTKKLEKETRQLVKTHQKMLDRYEARKELQNRRDKAPAWRKSINGWIEWSGVKTSSVKFEKDKKYVDQIIQKKMDAITKQLEENLTLLDRMNHDIGMARANTTVSSRPMAHLAAQRTNLRRPFNPNLAPI